MPVGLYVGGYPSGKVEKHSRACMQGCYTTAEVPDCMGHAAVDDTATHALPHDAAVCAGAGVVDCGSGPWVRLGAPRCCRSGRSGVSICATLSTIWTQMSCDVLS